MAEKELKKPQHLKFKPSLEADLKMIAKSLGRNYNQHVELVLSSHVYSVKEGLLKLKKEKNHE